jgi:Protein of unknown function (DUF1559)
MVYDCELDGYPGGIPPQLPRRPWWMSTWGLMKAIFALGCGLGLMLLWYRFPDPTRRRQPMCVNSLKQIALALHNYHARYGSFPPAFIADASGRPMHSWRVLILPFLAEGSLYDRYDFREPWDGPNNIRLLGKMPRLFACPSHWGDSSPTDRTNYAAITGPGTMFPGAETTDFGRVSDGSSNTLLIVEAENVDIPWTAPVDLDVRTMSFKINDRKRPSLSSRHPGGANVSSVEGSVRFLPERAPPDMLRALITRAGGEKIDD